jgi:hypothetical protein
LIPGPPPLPPPRSGGSRLLIGCSVFVVLLVVLGAALGVAFLATGGAEMLKPVEPVTFTTIGNYPEYRRVTLVGRLDLPTSLHCDDECGVWLQDPGDAGRQVGLFIDVATSGETAAPNQMERMPALYETEDFTVRLAGGGYAGDGALVRITGPVCRTVEDHDVCLRAEVIEAGD